MVKAWKQHRQDITRLYIHEARPLREVRDIMFREYKFNASIRSYRQHFGEWKLHKYNCKKRQQKAKMLLAQRYQGGPMPLPSPPRTPDNMHLQPGWMNMRQQQPRQPQQQQHREHRLDMNQQRMFFGHVVPFEGTQLRSPPSWILPPHLEYPGESLPEGAGHSMLPRIRPFDPQHWYEQQANMSVLDQLEDRNFGT